MNYITVNYKGEFDDEFDSRAAAQSACDKHNAGLDPDYYYYGSLHVVDMGEES